VSLSHSCGVMAWLVFAIEVLIVLIGAVMLWKRDRLARYVARRQQARARAMPGRIQGV
jgi:heme exporter protein D